MAHLSHLQLALASVLFSVALACAGGCLSVSSGHDTGGTGFGEGSGGQATSGQATSGQGNGGQASTGGSATAGGCGATLSLMVIPSTIDFGPTPVDTAAKRSVVLTNCSTAPVTGIEATPGGRDATLFAIENAPATIGPYDSATVTISYAPLGNENTSQATVIFQGSDGEKAILSLSGEPTGGGPAIACTPLSVAFGPVFDHDIATVPVICTNVGISSSTTANLVIDAPTASPFVFSAEFDETVDVYPLNGLAPGQSTQIDVSYAPIDTSDDTGTLTIKSNVDGGQALQIPLVGEGLEVSPCQFAVAPQSLDFGNVQIGDSRSLAFQATNVGDGICVLGGPEIANDASGDFRIVATSAAPDPVTGRIAIPESASLTVTIAFSPISTGAFSADIPFPISSPSDPNQAVELSGTSEDICLQVSPVGLDFGQVGTADGGFIFTSQTKSFTVSNDCQSSSASIVAVTVQNGPGDEGSQYSEPSGPTLPDSLQPGSQATFQLDCQPTSIGQHPAEVLISDGNIDVLLPMTCSVQ